MRNPDVGALAAAGRVRTIHDGKNPPARGSGEGPRQFSPADKALIRKVHGFMPAGQLLGVLNERLQADDPDAERFTIAQLHEEIGEVTPAGDSQDWASLRKLVAKARRDGLLDKVTRQLIDDFAVVFSLSAGQVVRLQDVLLRSKEGDES